jgi:hypothetical protein
MFAQQNHEFAHDDLNAKVAATGSFEQTLSDCPVLLSHL